ncbi:MAG: bifunctional DNA primase/polymerase [Xanthobacteraceae bacterium]
MNGGYALVGAKLVERGYSAIPIMPGTKRPGHMRGGEWIGMDDWRDKYTKRLPTQFEIDIWSRTEAGVCVVCGPASHGLVGIDIDTDDEKIIAAFDEILPATPVAKRGQKGETRFYLAPEIAASKSYNLHDPKFITASNPNGRYRVCDIIGPGRQTVLPPTIHPDTHEPYRWIGAALEDFDPDDLPRLDADIADQIAAALKPFGYEEEKQHAPLSNGGESFADKPHRQLNETALANLDAWVPKLQLYRCKRRHQGYEAVPTWRASNTGQPINKRKLNLKIAPDGIRDFGDDKGYTPIDLVMASQGCDLDTAVSFLAGNVGWAPLEIITIGRKEKPAKDISDLEVVSVEESDDEPKRGDPLVTSFVPESDVYDQPDTKDPFAHLTNVPGVLGDLIDWITATDRRPNRTLSMAAAIPVIGTLIGRRVVGPTRAATHLYCLGLAKTGVGKQHKLSCAIRAMTAAKAQHHLGPSEFVSMTAFINMLMRTPLALCPQDEFGAFLARVNGRNASSHEIGISKSLRMAWGLSFEPFVTPEYASRKSEIVRAPAISIFGMSTFDEFYESLQGRDVTNGFLNRFLVLATNERPAPVETIKMKPGKVPEKLIDDLQSLYNWDGTQLGTARLNDPGLEAEPDEIHWASDAAKKAFHDLEKHVEAEMDARPEIEPFIARTAEIGVRLATIRAAGRLGRGATLSIDDMDWGREIALASAEMMAGDAAKHMIVEMSHGKIANRILELLRRKGRTKKRDLMRAMGNGIKSRDFDDAMKSLAESGQVDMEKSRPASGGPETIWLKIAA